MYLCCFFFFFLSLSKHNFPLFIHSLETNFFFLIKNEKIKPKTLSYPFRSCCSLSRGMLKGIQTHALTKVLIT